MRRTLRERSGSTRLSHYPGEVTSTSEESSTPTISSAELRKKPVVVVDWYDAVCAGRLEWQDMTELQEALDNGPSLAIRSVGILAADETNHIVYRHPDP